MSAHHLYIANPREHALMQIKSFGRSAGLGTDACSVLRECVAQAWDDGFAGVAVQALARNIGITGAARAALRELADRGVIELQELIAGSFVVRPLLLSSDVGTPARVGWWQRLELDYDA